MATYLYGIVSRPERQQHWGTGVGRPPRALRLVAHGQFAALVSDIGGQETESEGRALRRDLRAHEEVVRRAMERGTVLPVSFGTVFADDRQLVEELLEPNAEELATLLEEFDGLVELMLKVEFMEDAVIRRVLEHDAELLAWRDSAGFGGPEEQIAFGQALSEAIENEGARRAERLFTRLSPVAEDARVSEQARGTVVLKASFLVDEQRLDAFDKLVAQLSDEAGALTHFDYIGPLPPYSFIHLNLGARAV